jgi:hypothetical protein
VQRWQDELSKHGIHTTLQMLEDQVARNVEITDPIQASEKTRFAKVVKMIRRAVADLDPDLAPIEILDQLNSSLIHQGVVPAMNTYALTSNPALFESANNSIRVSLSYVYQLSTLKFARSTRRADLDAATVSFQKFADATRKSYEELQGATKNGMAEINSAISRTKEIEARAEKAEDSINAKLLEFQQVWLASNSQQQLEFVASQSKRQEEYSKLVSEVRSLAERDLATVIGEGEATLAEDRKKFAGAVQSILEDADAKHRSILKLYNLAAKDSVSGGHQNIAGREYLSAEIWRGITIASVIAAIAWVAYSLFCFNPVLEPERLFWLQIGKSISLAGLLISLAVYASRQSVLHRINERRLRAFFLQVQAFDPFIAELPKEMQVKLKEEITKKIFGSDDKDIDGVVAGKGDFEGIGKTELLEKAFKIFSLLAEKARG